MGAWWSSKPTKVPVTVVTQASVDRISQLSVQCRSWRGPLAVVLYTSVVQPRMSNLTEGNMALLEAAHAKVRATAWPYYCLPATARPDCLLAAFYCQALLLTGCLLLPGLGCLLAACYCQALLLTGCLLLPGLAAYWLPATARPCCLLAACYCQALLLTGWRQCMAMTMQCLPSTACLLPPILASPCCILAGGCTG